MRGYNCLCTISQFTGSATNKTYAQLAANVKVMIAPASGDIVVLYPDIPIDKLFSFVIRTNTFTDILPASKISVTDGFGSEVTNGQTFIVKQVIQRNKIMGNFIIAGVCAKL